MSHVLTISDETYHALETLAQRQGQTPESLIETWVTQQIPPDVERDPHTDPRYESFDEFFLGLGMTEDEIRAAEADAGNADANL